MTRSIDEQKFGKIIQLAKSGIGGEKEAALRIVKRLCKENDLSFDDVMKPDEKVFEYTFYYRTKAEKDILSQALWRYGVTDDHPGLWVNSYRKVLFIKCTKARYIEVSYVVSVYLKAFRHEMKKIIKDMADAFIIKHRLFSSYNPDLKESRPESKSADDHDFRLAMRLSNLAAGLEDVTIRKALHK